jgi:hypothetical protein
VDWQPVITFTETDDLYMPPLKTPMCTIYAARPTSKERFTSAKQHQAPGGRFASIGALMVPFQI